MLACCLFAILAAAETRVSVEPRAPARRIRRAASIRVASDLVLIPVTVTDPFGAPVAGLGGGAFRLFEDGVEQRIKYFSSEDAPISLGVIFDASRSMQDKIGRSHAALVRFLKTAIPGDEYFLLEFSDAPRLVCNFTSDAEEIQNAIAGIRTRNWTALVDAVYAGTQHLRRARNPRKALLILSDGADNYSRYTESEMKSLVREADVCIYSIALVGGSFLRRHARLLRGLAEETGGLVRLVDDVGDLPDAVAKISAAIRNQYVLGYAPARSKHDGLYRKIQVQLSLPPGSPRLRASWRAGYYAHPED
jgi:Ca-activated chloride channel family protein